MADITPIDASIPLSGQTTSATLADIMKSQNLESEIRSRTEQDKLARQQQQQNAVQMQQQQKAIADQNKLSEHLSDPLNAARVAGGDMSSLYKLGIQPSIVQGIEDHVIKSHKEAALGKETDLKNSATLDQAAADGIAGLKTITDLNERRAQLPGMFNRWRQMGIVGPGAQLPDPNSLDVSDDGLQKLAVQAHVGKAIADAGLKRQQEQAALGKTAAETGKLGAETGKATAETGKIQTEIPKLEADAAIRAQQAANMENGMLPEEVARNEQAKATQAQAASNARETQRHNLSQEANAKITAGIAAGHLAQIQMVNGMRYGPDTTTYWVKQIHDSPDSIKEMPPELRSTVGKAFTQATGLPLPVAAPATSQAQELAARNALDGVDFIQNALKNPTIAKNIGPILGRLGEGEQALGASLHLNAEDEKLAQELRTRMKYFVFQEGKAVLGGRLPQQLMQQLESSSANVHMDAGTLAGALKGAEGNAHGIIDNVERQRFGGQMRSDAVRHPTGTVSGNRGAPAKIFARDPSGTLHEATPGTPLPAGWKLEK